MAKIPCETTKSGMRFLNYRDFPGNAFVWVKDQKYRPIPYDAVYLKIKDKHKIVPGWWNGHRWVSHRLIRGDLIEAWKRNETWRTNEEFNEEKY